ncbi:MAG: 30S ribosomal protein S21 [Clostridia bacterium]|nr:30S ribosomal protein S21 [Clostridia bacterium]
MFLSNSSSGDSGNVGPVSSDLDESKTSEENKEKDSEHDNFIKVFSDYKRQSAGIISEAKKKEVYLKPSVRRKLKSELARKKRNKRNKNNYRFGK